MSKQQDELMPIRCHLECPKFGQDCPQHDVEQPEPSIELCPYCNTMKWPSHQANCPEKPEQRETVEEQIQSVLDDLENVRREEDYIPQYMYDKAKASIQSLLSRALQAQREADDRAFEEAIGENEDLTPFEADGHDYEKGPRNQLRKEARQRWNEYRRK